ncbi:uncharacterized protein LOC127850426 isoform X2 [Dreissena polymorpha]|uniref:uncharacterized protein LOC127850426 isoform X2 n=1 Tax=Dreissena polymorpha TaxID=45954 RepID=UPI002264BE57|nr:uncharacterized protein LOC127850426 isoform X2 [Dreissena polymorpha]
MHSSVIKCADDKYAFRLGPMDGCIEAYCLERISNGPMPTGQPPDISSIKPVINVAAKRVKDENELQFYCDFNPTANTKFHYKVSWTISQSSLSSHELHHSEPVRYLSQEDFRRKTMMTEKHLKAPTYFGLGVTIACSITASEDVATPESNPVISEEKFCGIRALNSSNHVYISNDKGADIYFELTVPFGCEKGFENQNSLCYLDITLFIPNSETNCNIPDIVQRKGARNSCGIRFHINDVGKPQKLHIQPKYPKLTANLNKPMTLILATSMYEAHRLFSEYAVQTMQVTVSTEQNILNNKYCYAVCDPHMLTFDGLPYENQMAGTFDLYINTEYNQKVQIRTQSCNNNGQTPFCVCGVAIQAGSDVFALSTCTNTILDVRFVQCDDRILREKVEKVSETLYRVSLPSGTYVEITLSVMGHNMNVYVYPSVADFMKTSGLCGSFDGTTTNDRLNRPGFNDPDPNKSWMMNTVDDLFNEHVALRPWEDHYRFCTCNEHSNSPTNIATCDVDIKKTCTAKPHFADRCVHSSHRKRRSDFGEYRQTDEGDFHKTVNVAFVSKCSDAINHRKERSIKTYTDETARSDCMQLLNTTAFQKCSSIPGLDFTSIINDCVLDAKITGTMDWTMSHLETIKSSCMQQIDIQKMPPNEDLDGMTITINGTSYSNISVDNASLSLSSVITQDMFEEIRMVSCLRECSGFGDCTTGSCICKKGHSGEDCSIDSTRPPEMKGIPDEGLCDLQERACKKTSVFGNNLASDNQVKCKIKPLEIHVTHEIVTKEDYRVIGVPQTYMEVSCQLAQRKKRSVDADIDGIVARVYNISLSNDGVNFSEEDTLVVYDSACVSCNKTDDTFTCKKRTDFCVNDGKCHGIGDTIGCYVCATLGNGSAGWQPDPGCTTTSYISTNNGTRHGLTSNTIGVGLTKSTTRDGLTSKTFGDGLTKSMTQDGLTSKTIGDGFTESTTRDGLTSNTTGDGLTKSPTQDGLTSKTIGAGLTKSTTQDGLTSKTIGDGLTKSTTQDDLTSKTIGDGLTKSTTQDGLTRKKIGDGLTKITTQVGLTSKTIGDGLTKSTTQDALTRKTIGDDLTKSTTQDGMTRKTIGDDFIKSTIQVGLTSKKIGDGLAKTTTKDGLTRKTIGDDFTKSTTQVGLTSKNIGDGLAKTTTQDGLTRKTSKGRSSPITTRHGLTSNTIGVGLTKSTTRDGLTSKTFGDGLTKSMTQDGLTNETSGDGFTESTARDGLTSKTTGDGLTKSPTQDGLTSKTIGAGLTKSTTQDGLTSKTIGDGLTKSPTQDDLTSKTIGDGLTKSTTQDGLTRKTIGDGLTKITTRVGLTSKTIGDGLTKSTSQDGLTRKTIGDDLTKSTTQDGLTRKTIGDHFTNSTTQVGLTSKKIGDGLAKTTSQDGLTRKTSKGRSSPITKSNGDRLMAPNTVYILVSILCGLFLFC